MNSEIQNVVKLSPLTVAKNDKQSEPRLPPSENKGDDMNAVAKVFASSNVSQVDTVKSIDGKDKESKKTELGVSLDVVKKAVDEGNSFLQIVKRNLQFQIDDTTNEVVVKVIDSESGELVRQIPSEEVLALIQRMKEQEDQQESQGLMIQDRV